MRNEELGYLASRGGEQVSSDDRQESRLPLRPVNHHVDQPTILIIVHLSIIAFTYLTDR